jgi:transcriptional regulator with XRE-family HTH domain
MSPTDRALAAILLGASLRRLRLARGISRKRLALEAGVTMETIGRIERGKGNPRLETLWSIAAALDASLAEMVMTVEEQR